MTEPAAAPRGGFGSGAEGAAAPSGFGAPGAAGSDAGSNASRRREDAAGAGEGAGDGAADGVAVEAEGAGGGLVTSSALAAAARRTRAGGRPFAGRAQLLLQNLHLVLQFLVLAREAADVALKPIDAKGHSRGFGARFALGRQVIDVRRGAIVVLGHDRAAGRDVRGIKSLRGAGAEQEGGGESETSDHERRCGRGASVSLGRKAANVE